MTGLTRKQVELLVAELVAFPPEVRVGIALLVLRVTNPRASEASIRATAELYARRAGRIAPEETPWLG